MFVNDVMLTYSCNLPNLTAYSHDPQSRLRPEGLLWLWLRASVISASQNWLRQSGRYSDRLVLGDTAKCGPSLVICGGLLARWQSGRVGGWSWQSRWSSPVSEVVEMSDAILHANDVQKKLVNFSCPNRVKVSACWQSYCIERMETLKTIFLVVPSLSLDEVARVSFLALSSSPRFGWLGVVWPVGS